MQKYRSILLTRPIRASRRTRNDLLSINSGLEILISPLIEIQYTTYDFFQKEYSGYIFTSENAILSLMFRGVSLGRVDVYCVGHRTQRLATKLGYNVLGTFPRVKLMVRRLSKLNIRGKLFYFRGAHVSCDLKSTLGKEGIEIEELVVYNQLTRSLSKEAFMLLTNQPSLIPLYSARTARLFSKEASELASNGHLICAMSENIKREVILDWNIEVAPRDSSTDYVTQFCHT